MNSITAKGCYINNNRNACINLKATDEKTQILDKNTSHYLMYDADIIALPRHVQMLIDRKMPIVCGWYESRVVSGNATGG